MISATYFDGLSGTLYPVTMGIIGDAIHVLGQGIDKSIQTDSARLGEPFEHAPCVLDFSDGSRCEIGNPADRARLLAALNYKKSLIVRWQEKWLGALVAIIVMVCALCSAYYWGIPWAADRASNFVPIAWEKKLGDEVFVTLDKQLFEPTGLSDERVHEVENIFQHILPPSTRMPIHVVVRNSKSLGANALALPNGTIVVTDGMVNLISGADQDLNDVRAEQLSGVLAHEIGHIEHRHSLKNLMGKSFTGALSWAMFGDFSAVVAGAPALFLQLEYSRGMETEADDYAADLLRKNGISPVRLAEVFELMETSYKRQPAAELPRWMRSASDYLSTHPSSVKRMARLRQPDNLALSIGGLAPEKEPANKSGNSAKEKIKYDTVYDAKTNLTWQRCSVGQHWAEGNGCVGEVKKFTFDDAQRLGDGTWRVPTKDELATLIDHGRVERNQSPTIDEVAFPNTPSEYYWTSTTYDASDGWLVSFGGGGFFNNYFRIYPLAVRLVRSGQ